MLAIDEAKLPPPTPASPATTSSVEYETPGLMTTAARIDGTSSNAALMTVQVRPPKRATANVYGTRSAAPISAGSAVSRNLPAGSTP